MWLSYPDYSNSIGNYICTAFQDFFITHLWSFILIGNALCTIHEESILWTTSNESYITQKIGIRVTKKALCDVSKVRMLKSEPWSEPDVVFSSLCDHCWPTQSDVCSYRLQASSYFSIDMLARCLLMRLSIYFIISTRMTWQHRKAAHVEWARMYWGASFAR